MAWHIKKIWSFKRKRKLDGDLQKHKYQLCSYDVMQQWGDSYWETYLSVVNMLSIHLILVIYKIHNLGSKAINFVLAFLQAYLEECIWMKLPIGFQVNGQSEACYKRYDILLLNKNLY